MRVGKKLVVVLSVLATGIGAAIFFRKDASQVDTRQGTLSNPFGQRVERRILAGAAWARKIGGPLPALPGRPPQPLRVPASATAAILEPKALTPEAPPIFQKTSPSVGALLEPIDGVLPDDEKPGAAVGFDFRFGHNRTGTPDLLAAEGERRHFAVDIVPAVEIDGLRISSGVIREALRAGRVEEAIRLLGHPWFVSGEVVHGDKRGRELGYPTANLRLDPACELKHGIYAVRVGIGERRYDGVASFGRRPMFDVGTVLLEVFLFDFAGDLYGATIDVAFIGWLRPELVFDTVDDLVRRMDEDSKRAQSVLARAPVAFPALGQLPA